MLSVARRVLCASILFLAIAAPAAANIIYDDNTFNLADYMPSPTYSSDTSASITDSSTPGTLEFLSTFTEPGDPANGIGYTVAQGLANTTFTYDPSTQGPIISISTSVDKNITTNFTGDNFTNTYRPSIIQGGVFYLAAVRGPTFTGPNEPGGTGFLSLSAANLGASDFLNFDFTTGTFGSAHPDFAGAPILLGITQITGIFSNETGYLRADYQQLHFFVRNVPEPGSLALLAVSLLALTVIEGLRGAADRSNSKDEESVRV